MFEPATAPETVSPLFGRLSLSSIPYHEPILVATFAASPWAAWRCWAC